MSTNDLTSARQPGDTQTITACVPIDDRTIICPLALQYAKPAPPNYATTSDVCVACAHALNNAVILSDPSDLRDWLNTRLSSYASDINAAGVNKWSGISCRYACMAGYTSNPFVDQYQVCPLRASARARV